MHKQWTGWRSVAGGLLLGCAVVTAAPDTNVVPLRVTATLSDGSKIIGQPALKELPLRTEFSKMEIPLEKISALKFTPGTAAVALALVNGDKLSATLDLAELRLTTLFGKTTLPVKLLTALTISAGGAAAAHEGLILWYAFDGAQGLAIADASRREHTGKLFHGARIVADEGRRRDVLELDGRGAHIRVPGSPDFAVTNATMAVWLQPEQWNNRPNGQAVILSTVSLNSFDGWEFFIGGPRLIAWHCRFPSNHSELGQAVPLDFENDTDWQFIAFSFAYQAGVYTVTTYCNGKPVKQEKHPAAVMGYSGQVMHIGINYDSPAAEMGRNYRREFAGRMDDLMLFNRALNAEEIAALYQAQR